MKHLLKINILFLTIKLYSICINANPGDLDTTFGTNGIVTTTIGTISQINAVAIQPDGKILAAGQATISSKAINAIARYNNNGSLDTTFGTNGIITKDTAVGSSLINAIAIQSDGKIVTVGSGTGSGITIMRFNANGSMDSSFGTNGVFTSTSVSTGRSIALQSDGKILAGGQSGGMKVARVNSDGTLDSGFGSGGIASVLSNAASDALAVQSDGKIVSTGQAASSAVIARFNTDGSLDTSFAGSGVFTFTPYDTVNLLTAVSIQSDNKIISSGTAAGSGHPYTAMGVRFNTDGSFDTSFGGTGKAILNDIPSVQLTGMVLQNDGKMVSCGYTTTQFLILRFTTNGLADSSFGTSGYTITQVDNTTSQANCIAIQSDQKVVVGGYSGSSKVFTLARYLTSNPLPVNLTYYLTQGNSLIVNSPGLLTGQPDGSSAILSSVPNYGIISTNPDGSFVYVPNLYFNGIDSFTYNISTGGVVSDVVNKVQITVFPNPNIPTSGLGSELVKAIQKKYGTKTK